MDENRNESNFLLQLWKNQGNVQMEGNCTVYKRKHNSQKKKCCFEDKKKMQKWLLVGFSTDLWQTFFTLSQRRRSEITRFSPKVIFDKVLRRALFMKHNLIFMLKTGLDYCLSKTLFLTLLLVKVNASQSCTKYFIQEIRKIKIA